MKYTIGELKLKISRNEKFIDDRKATIADCEKMIASYKEEIEDLNRNVELASYRE